MKKLHLFYQCLIAVTRLESRLYNATGFFCINIRHIWVTGQRTPIASNAYMFVLCFVWSVVLGCYKDFEMITHRQTMMEHYYFRFCSITHKKIVAMSQKGRC